MGLMTHLHVVYVVTEFRRVERSVIAEASVRLDTIRLLEHEHHVPDSEQDSVKVNDLVHVECSIHQRVLILARLRSVEMVCKMMAKRVMMGTELMEMVVVVPVR